MESTGDGMSEVSPQTCRSFNVIDERQWSEKTDMIRSGRHYSGGSNDIFW